MSEIELRSLRLDVKKAIRYVVENTLKYPRATDKIIKVWQEHFEKKFNKLIFKVNAERMEKLAQKKA